MGYRAGRRQVKTAAVAFAAVLAIASLASVSAQAGGGLSIPVVSTGQAGSPGVLRITQFTLLDDRTAVAVGTLSVSATGTDGQRTIVTQVAVPVIGVTSATARSASAGVATPAAGAGGTQASGFPGTTSGTGHAGTGFGTTTVTPGQVATCGPLRVALGPLRIARQGLTMNVPRLEIEIDGGADAAASSIASQGSSMLASAVCSAEAALATPGSRTGAFGGTGTTTTGATGTTGAAVSGTFGTGASTTSGTTTSGGVSGAGTDPVSALQNLVTALNGVLGAL